MNYVIDLMITAEICTCRDLSYPTYLIRFCCLIVGRGPNFQHRTDSYIQPVLGLAQLI